MKYRTSVKFFTLHLLLFLACLSMMPQGLLAATITWTGATDELWERGSNWSGGSVPGSGDDVVIPSVGNGNYPEISDTRNAKSVVIRSGADLVILNAGRLNINGASGNGLDVSGSFTNAGLLYINNVGGSGIDLNTNGTNVTLRGKTYIGNTGNIGNHGIFINRGSLTIRDYNDALYVGTTILTIDRTADLGIYNFGGSVDIDEVSAGLFSSRTTVTIGGAGSSSIGEIGVLNAANFDLSDGTLNVRDAASGNAGVVNRFINTSSPRFRVLSGATLNIGSSGNQLPQMGMLNQDELIVNGNLNIENTASYGLNNYDKITVGGSGRITISDIDDDGILNYEEIINNGTINLGATSKPIELNGIRNERLSGTNTLVSFTNNGTLNMKYALDNGIQNSNTADFTNTGNLNIGEIEIGLRGILNQDNGSAFVNNGGTIRVDNCGSQGAVFNNLERTAIIVENASSFTNQGGGVLELGQGDGNILGLGVFVLGTNAVFNNSNGQIKVDQVGFSAIAVEVGNARFSNAANGELIIGQAAGSVGRDGISISGSSCLLENEGMIKIDECSDNGIFADGPFLNKGTGKVWIGQNTGNISEYGLFVQDGVSFTNQGNSELLIDNVGNDGIYLNRFNPSFINQGNAKTIIGKNGPIGGATHAAIESNNSTFQNIGCAELRIYDFIKNTGSFTNAGYLAINTANAHTNSGTITNNGVLQYSQTNPIPGLVNNDMLIFLNNSGACTLTNVFQTGAANNFSRNGNTWYADEALSVAAGTYNPTNNNFSLSNYPEGSYLFFEVSGNSCTFLIQLEYELAVPNSGSLTWTGESSAAWNEACNWLPIKVPASGDKVIIPVSTTYPLISNGVSSTIESLDIDPNAQLSINYGGVLNIDGALGVGARIEGVLNNSGTLSIDNTTGPGIFLSGSTAKLISNGDVLIGQNGSALNIGNHGIALGGFSELRFTDDGTDDTPTLLIDNCSQRGITVDGGNLNINDVSSAAEIVIRIGALGVNSISGNGIHLSSISNLNNDGGEIYIDHVATGLRLNTITTSFSNTNGGKLEIGGSGNTISQNGIFTAGSLNNTSGEIIISNTNFPALYRSSNTISNSGGTMRINGRLFGITSLDGTIAPGNSPGKLESPNNLNISSATLEIEIDGTTQGVDYDWLDVTGTATLGGTLKPVINFVPTTGDRIVFLTATTISGTFSSTNPALPAGWGLDYSIPGEVSLLYNPAIFPVEFLEFEAKIVGQSSQLNWATAKELNNDGFEVEHRTESSDWGKIGFVKGLGTTDQISSYEYQHADPQKGMNYYRLKQIDLDGNFEYSPSIELNFSPIGVGLILYPNPASERVNIKLLDSFSRGKLQVFDLKGQLVFQTVLDKNQSSTSLETQTWGAGAYQLLLQLDNKLYSRKFLISQ
ncbi:MAG: T9SS type A sorting domain-containing protein [Bacteroidia bacterium]|nr:T9SS type A sorting domain-containing protein [Bacteroidia bacterium]